MCGTFGSSVWGITIIAALTGQPPFSVLGSGPTGWLVSFAICYQSPDPAAWHTMKECKSKIYHFVSTKKAYGVSF